VAVVTLGSVTSYVSAEVAVVTLGSVTSYVSAEVAGVTLRSVTSYITIKRRREKKKNSLRLCVSAFQIKKTQGEKETLCVFAF